MVDGAEQPTPNYRSNAFPEVAPYLLLYATTAGGVSVGALFMAGYLPGALLAIALMVGSYILAVWRNYPKGEKFSLATFGKQLGKSIWALLAVLISFIPQISLWLPQLTKAL